MQSELFVMLLIFFARVIDQSLGTFRIIMVSRGNRLLAPLIGFVEIIIWLVAISKALASLSGPLSYIIYAGGFAVGNYMGMFLEGRISIGYQSVRIITTRMVSALPLTLREEGWGITIVEGAGMKGSVSILYTVVARRDLNKLIEIVNTLEPEAFVTIEDVRSFQAGFISRKRFIPGFGLSEKKK